MKSMELEVKITYEVNEESWNKNLQLSLDATASQIADCYLPHKLTYNSKPVFITIFDSTEKIVGQLSAVIHVKDYGVKNNFLSNLIYKKVNSGSTLRWSHGPIIHDKKNIDIIFSKILLAVNKIAKDNNVNVISGTTSPQMSSIPTNILKKNGYNVKPWFTYITNLERNIDEIYNSLHNKTRYDIRKGEKMGFEFKISSTRKSMDIYLDLKHDGKKAKNMKKKYKGFTDNIWETLFQNDYKKNFIVKKDGKPLAFITNFLFNENVSQVGVATSSGSKYAGSFLTWNTIKWAVENNYRTYDVGGANPNPISAKEKGIDLFKSKWASEKVEYFICTKIFNKTKYNISKMIKNPKGIKYKINKKIGKQNYTS